MKDKIIIVIVFVVLGLLLFIPRELEVFAPEEAKAYVVLVIDDFGNNGKGTDSIINLNIPITGAVIPGMPFALEEADKLHSAGKEVILHVPLEPEQGRSNWLGPSGILTRMEEQEARQKIIEGLEEVKYAVGMNNHMGSKAMKDEKIVNIITDIAKEKELFFLDSKTTDPILSKKLCKEKEVVFLERDLFLDNEKSINHVKKQMNKLSDIALKKGYAIAIGHVGRGGEYTAQGIKESIPILEEKGIQFITLKELIQKDVISSIE